MRGLPILPPTKVLKPHAAKISPVRVVVVVLPLVPVMAAIGAEMAEAASSISLITRRFWARASMERFDVHRHAGAHHDQVGHQETMLVMPPELVLDRQPLQFRQVGGEPPHGPSCR